MGDVCDNCVGEANATQSDIDGDGAGDRCDLCIDGDGDGYGFTGGAPGGCLGLDCDDTNPAANLVAAAETNDGYDNQCPGEYGYGLVDEISGSSGFFNPADEHEFSWPAQFGATTYEIARSDNRVFLPCVTWQSTETTTVDATTPIPGQVLYYLIRALEPNAGSWGSGSGGIDRQWVNGDALRMNFSPASSAVPGRFVKDDGSIFDPARGYGWSTVMPTRERGSAFPLELDTFVMSATDQQWELELADGEYAVHVVSGDASYAQGPHRVRVQGVAAVDDVASEAGQFIDATVIVSVRGGRLIVQTGGTGAWTMLNLLEVVELPGGPI